MNNSIFAFYTETYSVIQTATSNISDSFVIPDNKTGTGSGEARLYISSQSNSASSRFFTFTPSYPITKTRSKKVYDGCPYKCILSKENLIEYMNDAEKYYKNPTREHRSDIRSLFSERLDKVNSLPDFLRFNVYNQEGDADSSRFYIGSVDDAWDLIRELSIPYESQLNIYKMQSVSENLDIAYYFELQFGKQSPNHYNSSKIVKANKIEEQIEKSVELDSTEKEALISSRVGQGKFREKVLNLMPRCPFTQIENIHLLRASHIIPWSECATGTERLDPYNGLTLTPTYDTLFDFGLISFENDGALKISSLLQDTDITALNINANKVYEINNKDGRRNEYLEYHRKNIFKGK